MTTKGKGKEKKITKSYSMTKQSEELLNEIYIRRFQENSKTKKSDILCEAIALLHQQEFNKRS